MVFSNSESGLISHFFDLMNGSPRTGFACSWKNPSKCNQFARSGSAIRMYLFQITSFSEIILQANWHMYSCNHKNRELDNKGGMWDAITSFHTSNVLFAPSCSCFTLATTCLTVNAIVSFQFVFNWLIVPSLAHYPSSIHQWNGKTFPYNIAAALHIYISLLTVELWSWTIFSLNPTGLSSEWICKRLHFRSTSLLFSFWFSE